MTVTTLLVIKKETVVREWIHVFLTFFVGITILTIVKYVWDQHKKRRLKK